MATVEETIRRLTIQAESKGLTQTTEQLRQLQQAQGGVTVESVKSAKATMDMEKRLQSIERQYDKVARAEMAMARVSRELNAIEAQGLITKARKNELLKLAAARHAEAAGAAGIHARALAGLNAMANTTGGALTRMLLPYASLIAGGVGVGAYFTNTIAQEQALAQLEATIQSTGGAAGYTTGELAKMASQMQRVSVFGDDVVMSAQSVMLTYTQIGKETFPRAMQAAIDMAQAMGISLTQSAERVGKAIGTPTRATAALSDQGFVFTGVQKEMIKQLEESGRLAEAQAIILEELELAYAGSAAAARNTLGGALSSLSNAFGDLFEVSSDGSATLTQSINDLVAVFEDPKTIAAVQNFGAELFGAFAGIIRFLTENPWAARILAGGGAGAAVGSFVPGVGTAIGALVGAGGVALGEGLDATVGEGLRHFRDPGGASGAGAFVGTSITVYGDDKGKAPPAPPPEPPGPTDAEIAEAKRLQKQFDQQIANYQKQTEALIVQAETFGMSTAEAARYRIEQELINLATRNNIALTDEVKGKIAEVADAYQAATLQLERMKNAQEAQKFLARSLFDAVRGADSLADAFSRLATTIAQAAMEAALLGTGPLASLLGMSSGSGGFLGSLVAPLVGALGGQTTGFLYHNGGVAGMTPGPTRNVHPAYFDDAPRYHNGGIAGLAPDEVPAILRRGEPVFRDMNHARQAVGAGGRVQIEVGVYVDDEGALRAIAREAGREGGAAAADVRVTAFSAQELPDRLRQIERHPRRRG